MMHDMTLLDFFMGHWTWGQLTGIVWPLALVGSSAFLAGYWRGRHVENEEWMEQVEKSRRRMEQ